MPSTRPPPGHPIHWNRGVYPACASTRTCTTWRDSGVGLLTSPYVPAPSTQPAPGARGRWAGADGRWQAAGGRRAGLAWHLASGAQSDPMPMPMLRRDPNPRQHPGRCCGPWPAAPESRSGFELRARAATGLLLPPRTPTPRVCGRRAGRCRSWPVAQHSHRNEELSAEATQRRAARPASSSAGVLGSAHAIPAAAAATNSAIVAILASPAPLHRSWVHVSPQVYA